MLGPPDGGSMLGAVIEYTNMDTQRRVWPDIQLPDGRTLELDAGETVELELAGSFSDPFLKPKSKPARKPASSPGSVPADTKEP